MTSTQQPLGEPVLAHHPGRLRPAVVGQLEVAVALDGEQAVALHPGHGLGHGRTALAEPLGDPGAQRDDALLLELEDRAQVHLGGVDEVAHACRASRPVADRAPDPSRAGLGLSASCRQAGCASSDTAIRRPARSRADRAVVPPRPAAGRPPGLLGRGRPPPAAACGPAAVRRSTRGSGTRPAPPRRAWLLRSLRALDEPRSAAGCVVRHGRPGRRRARRSPREVGAAPGARQPPTSGRTARRRDARGRGGAGRRRRPLVRDRHAVRRRARARVTKRRRHAVPGLHARSPGPGSRHGWPAPAPPPRTPAGVGDRRRRATPLPGRAATSADVVLPAGRRGGGAASAGATSSTTGLAGYADEPRPPGPRRHVRAVGAPEVGRDPPADAARRPRATRRPRPTP